jgi:hypothetical protein
MHNIANIYRFALLITASLLMTGCAGYRFININNPLDQFGIKSLSVVHFENYTTMGGPVVLLLVSFTSC